MKITLYPTDDFDKALSLNRDPGTEFVLTKGVYKTKGNWYYNDWLTLASGCKLYGEGSTLILGENATKSYNNIVRPDRDLNVIWVGPNTVVENLIIDGNESHFNNTDPSKTWFITTGIRSTGTVTINNVIVKNIRGTKNAINTLTKEIESFGISTVGQHGGSVIDNCIVQDCPENSYISAIGCGHIGNNVSDSIIRNCSINVGKNNWFGYGVNQNVKIKNCNIKNGPSIAVYNDTDVTENILVENCKFENIDKLVSLITVPVKNEFKRNIKIKNCEVIYSSGPIKHLVELWDKNLDSVKRQMGPVLIYNTSISMLDSNSKLYVACVGNDVRPVVLLDCNISHKIEMSGNTTFVNFS